MNTAHHAVTGESGPRKHSVQWQTEWREKRRREVSNGTGVVPGGPFQVRFNHEDAAEEQLENLIRRVFFPGWPRPAHHVVFLTPDKDCETETICAQVAGKMAKQVPGSTCTFAGRLESLSGSGVDAAGTPAALNRPGGVEKDSFVLAWAALVGDGDGSSTRNLQERLIELQKRFDYILIPAPPDDIGLGITLGQMADGVIITVTAHVTRRAAALSLMQALQVANVRVLGVVLAGRTFPIPEAIYRRL